MFADDLIHFNLFKSMTPKIMKEINDYLKEIEDWANDWRFSFAPEKSSFTIFTRRNSLTL